MFPSNPPVVSPRRLPLASWVRSYDRGDLRSDLAAGLTVGAMMVPQAMAYALLAGLPPEVGLYAATVPVLVYALLGSSRHLSVGPVAIVSLLTATALSGVVDGDAGAYLAAAALLALLVGIVHLVLGLGRLGFLVNFLSHSVLVGFTAAAAIIIGFSQVKHVMGIKIARTESFAGTVAEVGRHAGETHGPTLALGLACIVAMFALKRWVPRVPAALAVVIASILAVRLGGLDERGVSVVGDIPASLPRPGLGFLDLGLAGELLPTAVVITIVGFMQTIAVVRVYARRHHYDVDANAELFGLGAANIAAGVFGGYPITGGFSRTAVNDTAGARTPLSSVVTAGIVIATIAFLTPLFSALPNAALGAIIIMSVIGLVEVGEMKRIARIKRSDLIGLVVAFVATLGLGIERGIAVAIVASMLVVFGRMSVPHTAILGRVGDTTSYRNVSRFPDVVTTPGLRIVRVDAALSFVNVAQVKRLLLEQAAAVRAEGGPATLILDASGMNDIDSAGVGMITDIHRELGGLGVGFHLAETKGPVRDVLHRAGLWGALDGCLHASVHDAVRVVSGGTPRSDLRAAGVDERPAVV